MKLNHYPNEALLQEKKAMVWRCFDLACGAKMIHTCETVSLFRIFWFAQFIFYHVYQYYLFFLQVFFPTLYDEHWFVFAVLFQHRMFVFLDSLYGEHGDYHKTVQSIIVSTHFFYFSSSLYLLNLINFWLFVNCSKFCTADTKFYQDMARIWFQANWFLWFHRVFPQSSFSSKPVSFVYTCFFTEIKVFCTSIFIE